MAVDKVRQGRNNKSRAKGYEREVAVIIGGKRHLADSGGPEDVSHPEYAIQVKSGLRVASAALKEGLILARSAATVSHKLPAVVLVDRSGSRLGYFICFDLRDFAEHHGYGKADAA